MGPQRPEGGVSASARAAACVLGASCVIVGALDMMLAWRGSYGLDAFPVFLILIGVFLLATGQARRNAGDSPK